MIINSKIEPQPGQVFEPGCFDENIGEVVKFMIDSSDHVGQGRIISVSVADDGTHAWLTLDVPNLASTSVDIGPLIVSTAEGPGYTGYGEEGL